MKRNTLPLHVDFMATGNPHGLRFVEGEPGEQSGGETAPPGFAPINSQAELDSRIGKRLERVRAEFSDYDDLKAKAAKLDDAEQANKSEIERAQEKAAAAEAKVGELPALVSEALRTHLVALHDIADDDAELFLTATEPTLLLKQVARLTAQSKKVPGRVPSQGTGDPGTRVSSYETGRERGLARYNKT